MSCPGPPLCRCCPAQAPTAVPEMPEADNVWFCAVCHEANVTRSDQDRCCLSCGVDLVSLGVLRALLSEVGLRIVGEAEAKVLEACEAIDRRDIEWFRAQSPYRIRNFAEAELARRGRKEEA